MRDPLGKYKEIIVARAVDEEIRNKQKSSGGAVAAIFIYLLEHKILDGVVIVEAKKSLQTEVVTARNREEMLIVAESERPVIPDLRGMKEAIVEKGLKNCGVFVTPCQAEGIRLMQEYPMTETDFASHIKLVISPFCSGTFTQKSFQTFLKEKQGLELAKVRKVGVTSDFLGITLTSGEIVRIPVREVLAHVQTGCLICHDLTATESDISAGVVSTAPTFTTLIVRSDFGKEAVEEAVRARYLEIAPLEIDKSFIEGMIKKMAEEKIRRAEILSLMS
jgi:coenzyme F420 hydrogenase subunit beta